MNGFDTRGLSKRDQSPEEAISEAETMLADAKSELERDLAKLRTLESQNPDHDILQEIDVLNSQIAADRDYIQTLMSDARDAAHKLAGADR